MEWFPVNTDGWKINGKLVMQYFQHDVSSEWCSDISKAKLNSFEITFEVCVYEEETKAGLNRWLIVIYESSAANHIYRKNVILRAQKMAV